MNCQWRADRHRLKAQINTGKSIEMKLKQTLLKIYQKIKWIFRAVFKALNLFRKVIFWAFRWLFKLSPSLKRKVFMAGAAYFYSLFLGGSKGKAKNKKSRIRSKK